MTIIFLLKYQPTLDHFHCMTDTQNTLMMMQLIFYGKIKSLYEGSKAILLMFLPNAFERNVINNKKKLE